jgi:hypothetical protein
MQTCLCLLSNRHCIGCISVVQNFARGTRVRQSYAVSQILISYKLCVHALNRGGTCPSATQLATLLIAYC